MSRTSGVLVAMVGSAAAVSVGSQSQSVEAASCWKAVEKSCAQTVLANPARRRVCREGAVNTPCDDLLSGADAMFADLADTLPGEVGRVGWSQGTVVMVAIQTRRCNGTSCQFGSVTNL